MRALILSGLLIALLLPGLQGQIHYRPPSNPAYSVTGLEPNSVLRPVSVSELSASLLNSFDQQGRLKADLGLEFAPYWFKSRRLSWEEYHNPHIWQSVLQSFQLSGANVYDSSLSKRVQSLGFRFQPYSGRPSQAYLNMSEERLEVMTFGAWANAARSLAGKEIKTVEAAIQWLDARLEESSYSEVFRESFRERAQLLARQIEGEDVQSFLEALLEQYGNDPIFIKTAEASREKLGFILEIAGATAFRPAPDKSLNTRLHRLATWISASYISDQMNQWTVSVRYSFDDHSLNPQRFDAGLSFARARQNFEFSLEAVWRYLQWQESSLETISDKTEISTYRIAANLNYHFNDKIFINLTMGKDYATPFYQGGFFNVMGINFDMFSPTVVQE